MLTLPMTPKSLDEYGLRRAFNSRICLVDYPMGLRAGYDAAFDGIGLGELDIHRLECSEKRSTRRAADHIELDPVDAYVLSLPLAGRMDISQTGTETTVEPGTAVLFSTKKPFETFCSSGMHAQYVVKIPGAMLRCRIHDIDKRCGRRIEIRPGAGTMMRGLLDIALADGKALSSTGGYQFGALVIEAISGTMLYAPEFEALTTAQRNPANKAVRERALEYIERNLADPALCIDVIARHCGTTKRSLHSAFAASGHAVGAHIREERLRRCRESLQQPANERTVLDIAMSWGFNDAAHFSHLYKARFGCAPSKDRLSPYPEAPVEKNSKGRS